jgi:hypothetical protein
MLSYQELPTIIQLWRGHGQETKIGEAGRHRITRHCEALGSFLLPCATTELSLSAVCCLIGATPRGQPWTPAVTLPHGRDGLSARRMVVVCTFREPSLCRHVHREFMRNVVLDLTPLIPATACHLRNYVERYSRSILSNHFNSTTRSMVGMSGRKVARQASRPRTLRMPIQLPTKFRASMISSGVAPALWAACMWIWI